MNDILWVSQVMLNFAVAAAAVLAASTLKSLVNSDEVTKRLRSEIESLKKLLESKDAQLESLKKEYELRLKGLHERIAMLESLDEALRRGKVKIVEIPSNEECKLLADGTIICGEHVVR